MGREFGKYESIEYNNIIDDLLAGKIIAWYEGRSEIGARALGHRSFIGLPDSIEMRRKLSERVKGREPYRPVAAIVLEEDMEKYFENKIKSPYMTFCSRAKKITKKLAPAIVHVDGTTRLQTMNEKDNKSILYNVLNKLKSNGIPPILMNSSLNVMAEPIVDSIEDAIKTFSISNADVLYINGKKWGWF